MPGKEIDVWQIVSALPRKAPLLKVNRGDLLREAFRKVLSDDQLETLVKDGPRGLLTIEQIDKAAARQISQARVTTSAASLVAGLPSNLIALPATISADVVQSFAFYIRTCQELAYLYGEDDIFADDDDSANTKLMIYIGSMFGISQASELVVMISRNAGQILAKKFMNAAVTKIWGGAFWRIAKMIAALLGIRLTKEIFAKGITKVLPVVGGIVSGAITYATFGPMAKRLKRDLHDTYCLSESEMETKIEGILARDPDSMVVDVAADIVEGAITDIDEIDEAEEATAEGE